MCNSVTVNSPATDKGPDTILGSKESDKIEPQLVPFNFDYDEKQKERSDQSSYQYLYQPQKEITHNRIPRITELRKIRHFIRQDDSLGPLNVHNGKIFFIFH